jgi:lipopolysaccharide assembly protein A
MTTEQPIPTPTPTSAPLPRPAIGEEAPPPTSDFPSTGTPGTLADPSAQVAESPADPSAPPAEVAPPAAAAATQAGPAHAGAPSLKPKHTRISGLWVAVGFFAVILLLLLIFILQNGKTVDVSYMGAHGHLPLGVALLLAAVCGVLLVVLAGAARISQLRTVARRHRRADSQRAKAAEAAKAGS